MAMQVPGADNQSSAELVPQISGSESETSVPRHVDLNLNLPTSIPTPTYNPYMLMQQIGPQNGYPTYQIADSQPLHYDQQSYMPSSLHGRNSNASQEVHYGYQRYHTPVQEQMQGYTELQQQNYMQQAEGYVQGAQTTFETIPQVPVHRILPRRLPQLRQRIRRRNRTNRGHISNIHSVTGDIAYSNREHSTATSITGSVTSGPIPQTAVDLEGSQERLSRLTSAVTALEESSGIGENFECNICFQKANEAVVTCCGHLFCWPCLYRWLHVHSYHKECPVCKGAIAEYSITPIYGREDALASARMQGGLGSERVPPRPAARRIESARQQREREGRERERELREAEARETTNQERIQGTEIDRVATVIVEEGDLRATGSEALTSEATPQREEDIPLGGADTAARLHDMERGVSQSSGEAGEPTEYSHSGYLQRRLAFRREQLRQALANNGANAGINQNPGSRSGEGQQMLTATALLSQEWEHIINGSRFMVDPTQAAAWFASIHARLADMEGHAEPNSDAVHQRRQMIASAVSQISQQPQEDSNNRLTVHPSQVSDWIITMRARLDNIEQIMHNLEGPIGGNQMPQLITSPDLGGVNPVQLTDTEVLNPNEFLSDLNATSAPQELVSDSERSADPDLGLNAANESQSSPERILPETHVVRRSRRRREHGEEASHTAGQEEGTEASHEGQVLVTRKRRRRLD